MATGWSTAAFVASLPPCHGAKAYVVYDYEYFQSASTEVRGVMEEGYRRGMALIATSGAVADLLVSAGVNPLAQVHCGIDPEEFGIDADVTDRDRMNVGFPIRVEPFKGTADAVEALELAREHHPELRAFGFGHDTAVGMPKWISSLGCLSGTALRALYNQCSVFVHPSRLDGWGLPGMEAMACGAALVASDSGGNRDYAAHEKTALVVPPGQPRELARQVLRMMEDDDLRVAIARAGAASISGRTVARSVARLANVLARVASEGQGR